MSSESEKKEEADHAKGTLGRPVGQSETAEHFTRIPLPGRWENLPIRCFPRAGRVDSNSLADSGANAYARARANAQRTRVRDSVRECLGIGVGAVVCLSIGAKPCQHLRKGGRVAPRLYVPSRFATSRPLPPFMCVSLAL